MKLHRCYNYANKLSLNEEKTTFLMANTETSKEKPKRFKIIVNDDEYIQDDLAVKVLGLWVTPDGYMSHHISKMKGPVIQTIAKLKPYIRYMNLSDRKEIIYSKALSIA